MIEPDLTHLRQLTALVYAVPHVLLRVQANHRTVIAVSKENLGSTASRWVKPCVFRRSVAQLCANSLVGNQATFTGVSPSDALSITLESTGNSDIHPGPIVETIIDGKPTLVFATTLAATATEQAIDQAWLHIPAAQRRWAEEPCIRIDTQLHVVLVRVDIPAFGLPAAAVLPTVHDLLTSVAMVEFETNQCL